VIGVLPFWFICKKAGLSPWLSLIMLIPFGAIVLPFVLAFIEWPSLRNKSAYVCRSLPLLQRALRACRVMMWMQQASA
jgi:hypothetical protein